MSMYYAEYLVDTPKTVPHLKKGFPVKKDYSIEETSGNKIYRYADNSKTKKDTFVYLDNRYLDKYDNQSVWLKSPSENNGKGAYVLYSIKEFSGAMLTVHITAEYKVQKKDAIIYSSMSEKKENKVGKVKSGSTIDIVETSVKTDKDGNIWCKVYNVTGKRDNPKVLVGYAIMEFGGKDRYINITRKEDPIIKPNGKINQTKLKDLKSKTTVKAMTTMITDSNGNAKSTQEQKEKESNKKYNKNGGINYGSKKGKVSAKTKGVILDNNTKRTVKENQKYGKKGSGNNYEPQEVKDIYTRAPSIVQNDMSFPKENGTHNGIHQYDYTINYEEDGFLKDIDEIHKIHNYTKQSINDLYKANLRSYNRFKLSHPDDTLSKGFVHIFFTRPDLNIYTAKDKINSKIEKDPNFSYAIKHRPDLINQLTQGSTNFGHDFMFLLSNKAGSFALSDESITNDTYGKTFSGHSIAFGRHNIASKAAGTFDITYTDNRDLDVFHIHKLWNDYISNVYKGKWRPRLEYIYNKIIDYACSVYYIVTAEDGETILMWSKYYGVFPLNVPSAAYSWSQNQPIGKTDITINYQYSFKEDFNPLSLAEFNLNSVSGKSNDSVEYIKTFNDLPESEGGTWMISDTWVGAPFIETVKPIADKKSLSGSPEIIYKLRFRPLDNK